MLDAGSTGPGPFLGAVGTGLGTWKGDVNFAKFVHRF